MKDAYVCGLQAYPAMATVGVQLTQVWISAAIQFLDFLLIYVVQLVQLFSSISCKRREKYIHWQCLQKKIITVHILKMTKRLELLYY